MILYALACINGHRFESWFRSSAGYDDQAGRSLVACPVCRSVQVSKTIMAPAVVSRGSVASVPVPVPAEVPAPEAPLLDERQRAAWTFLKSVRDRVLSEGEDVGDRFSDQARKMHEGDIPHRNIHGQATLQEARALLEDGVAILPIPLVPEELN